MAPLAQSFADSLPVNVEGELVFIASRDDRAEIQAVRATGFAPLTEGICLDDHQWSRKINHAVRKVKADWYLLGADDLQFEQGWLEEAVAVHAETGKLVIGTNDMGNLLVKQGRHATHPLVHRDYLSLGTIDDPSKLLHEGYKHNSVDVEFCETAMHRGQFAFAKDSIVRHLHPLWDRSVKRDATYSKGIRFAHQDRILLNKRRPLWRGTQDRAYTVGRPARSRNWAPRPTR